MRVLLWFLAGLAVVVVDGAPAAAQFGAAIPPSVSRPEHRDSMDYDVRVAVSGRVLLDDRQPPPEPIPVEYSCRGASRATLTDAKGRFSIGIDYQQAGRTNLSYNLPDVAGCRVQIRLPGFEEVLVTLKRPQALSDLNVGDLTLKPAGLQGAAVFSASGRNAPGKARVNYVRALDAINTGKYPEALASLDKAIAAYPEYAAALELKGGVLELMDRRKRRARLIGKPLRRTRPTPSRSCNWRRWLPGSRMLRKQRAGLGWRIGWFRARIRAYT